VLPLVVVSTGALDARGHAIHRRWALQALLRREPGVARRLRGHRAPTAFVSQWRDEEGGAGSIANGVPQHARAADLIIAAQADPQWPGTGWLDLAGIGRPVLIVPNSGGQLANPEPRRPPSGTKTVR
jgi:hypothetical protein